MNALLLVIALTAAPADPATQAKEAFAAGKKLYEQSKFADAVAKFSEAYKIKPHPVIFFNIGKCYEALGDSALAMRAYRNFLRLLPESNDRQVVADALANLERKLREKGVQQLMVFADPPAAQLEIDGKALSDSPAFIELTAGPHKLTAKMDGYDDLERSFNFNIGRSSEMTINLVPKGTATQPTAPVATDAPKATPDLTPAPTQRVTAKPAPSRHRTWTWVAGGVAVVGLGAAIGMGVVANGASADLRGSVHDRPRTDALVGTTQSMAMGANVTYAVAGAAAVTAVVLFFLEGRP